MLSAEEKQILLDFNKIEATKLAQKRVSDYKLFSKKKTL
jgi:hypothetical protein